MIDLDVEHEIDLMNRWRVVATVAYLTSLAMFIVSIWAFHTLWVWAWVVLLVGLLARHLSNRHHAKMRMLLIASYTSPWWVGTIITIDKEQP